MAVKRIKIGGVNYNINDSRIAAIDSTLSALSTNPIENQPVAVEFGKVAYIGNEEGSVSDPDFDPAADTVWNKEQTLSSAQQAQARANIGAVSTADFNAALGDIETLINAL